MSKISVQSTSLSGAQYLRFTELNEGAVQVQTVNAATDEVTLNVAIVDPKVLFATWDTFRKYWDAKREAESS